MRIDLALEWAVCDANTGRRSAMAIVLITGCSSGFGLLSALGFARRGHRVVATMRDPARGEELERNVQAERLPVTILPLDVCDPAQVTDTIERAERDVGPLDVLVNNAGIELRSSIEDADEADVRRQFDTNVFGPVRVIQAVLPRMRARRSGTIVNLSSIAGIVSRPYGGYYAASKHALEAISEALHYEVTPFGIRVILVEPGQYGTRLLDNAYPGRRFRAASPYWERSSLFDERVRRLAPGGKASDPEEVARLVCDVALAERPRLRYLAGGDAEMIAGAYRQTDFESFEQSMRQALDWWD
jgi:NAD(P)-dependent dehydrogenase (short-subunit alcohol dehydrogenase family)